MNAMIKTQMLCIMFLLLYSIIFLTGCGKSEWQIKYENTIGKINSLENDKNNLNNQISNLNNQIDGLNKKIDGINSENSSLKETVNNYKKENQRLSEKMNNLESDNKRMVDYNQELNKQTNNLDTKIKDYDQQLTDSAKNELKLENPNYILYSILIGIILVNNTLWTIFYRRKQ